jgi:hypothetical protein
MLLVSRVARGAIFSRLFTSDPRVRYALNRYALTKQFR